MSEVNPDRKFVDLVLAGDARGSDIFEYIEAWHDAPDDSPAAQMEVYEFLGLSWDEYRLWGEAPESLRFTLAARRAGQPLEDVLRQTELAGAAARGASQSEAHKVLDWLIRAGRVKANFHKK